jgi:hypothetical protein
VFSIIILFTISFKLFSHPITFIILWLISSRRIWFIISFFVWRSWILLILLSHLNYIWEQVISNGVRPQPKCKDWKRKTLKRLWQNLGLVRILGWNGIRN